MLESKDIIFKLGLEKEEFSKRKQKLRSSPNTVNHKEVSSKGIDIGRKLSFG
jgi:hypothetical protein